MMFFDAHHHWRPVILLAATVAFAGLAPGSSFGEQPGCSIPANVVIPFPDSLVTPKVHSDAIMRWQILRDTMGSQHWEWAQRQPYGLVAGQIVLIAPGEAVSPALEASDFFARDRRRAISVRSVTIDNGPRRIVLVVENGKRLTPELRAVASGVISGMLSGTRPEDSFGLITAGGPCVELPLGSNPEAIRERVTPGADSSQIAACQYGVADAVERGATWLTPPQPGDAIFVLALDLDGRHHASLSKVRQAIVARHIRVFDGELGAGPPTPYFDNWRLTQRLMLSKAFGNVDHLIEIGRSTGGLALVMSLPQSRGAPALAAGGAAIYCSISAYYELQLDSADEDLVVGLAPKAQDQLPFAFVSYPRDPAQCHAP
jgi:hypothetical protein